MSQGHKYSIYRDYYIDYSYQTGGGGGRKETGENSLA